MSQNASKAFGPRIPRCKLLTGSAYHGRCASKRSWFYGLRVQVVATSDGFPVEFYIHAGAKSEQTGRRFHYQATAKLNEHLQVFLLASNHAKRVKTLRALTPPEFVCAQWQKNSTIFTRDPTHHTLRLYI